jgi:hypothetical protein
VNNLWHCSFFAVCLVVAHSVVAYGCNPQFQFSLAGEVLEGGADAAPNEMLVDADAADPKDASGTSARCPEKACPNGRVCIGGACLECVADAECSGARPRCGTLSAFRNLCVECNAKADCGPQQDCNFATGHCVDTCSELNETCSQSGYACNDDKRICVTCLTRANCATSQAPNCDPQIGVCVACFSNAQCKDSKRGLCDRRDGQCYGCIRGSDCASGRCDAATRACVP